MPVVHVEANLTTSQLLKAVEQMPQEELSEFVNQVMILRAHQAVPRLSQEESELMVKINRGLDATAQRRYEELAAKREMEAPTAAENAEFLALAKRSEALDAERMKALAELAKLRNRTLGEVMQDLEIQMGHA